ncbi:MAG TPA: hypothetical protein VK042_03305 [Atopostipes sp.]|jgi:hypothetical protein|nr:hypothetical protein [Atopostipes sp.]
MISVTLGFASIVIFSLVYLIDFKVLHKANAAKLSSFAAGVGTVYVFIHMLPQLAHGQHVLESVFPDFHFFGSRFAIYLIALTGFVFFYMFERILSYTEQLPTEDYSTRYELYYYWTNVIFISLYSVLIGYVVGSYDLNNISYQLVYLLAYVLHFITIKWGLYHIFPEKYFKHARYPIALGLFIGYFIAYFFNISDVVLVIVEALLTGAMILNVFKHELPNEEDSKSRSFIFGLLVSTLLFMLI